MQQQLGGAWSAEQKRGRQGGGECEGFLGHTISWQPSNMGARVGAACCCCGFNIIRGDEGGAEVYGCCEKRGCQWAMCTGCWEQGMEETAMTGGGGGSEEECQAGMLQRLQQHAEGGTPPRWLEGMGRGKSSVGTEGMARASEEAVSALGDEEEEESEEEDAEMGALKREIASTMKSTQELEARKAKAQAEIKREERKAELRYQLLLAQAHQAEVRGETKHEEARLQGMISIPKAPLAGSGKKEEEKEEEGALPGKEKKGEEAASKASNQGTPFEQAMEADGDPIEALVLAELQERVRRGQVGSTVRQLQERVQQQQAEELRRREGQGEGKGLHKASNPWRPSTDTAQSRLFDRGKGKEREKGRKTAS